MSFRSSLSNALDTLTPWTSSKKFRILELPDELITLIVEHVHERKTLRRLARTCRKLQLLAEEMLYRRLLVRTSLTQRGLERALRAKTARLKAIQFLNAPCESERAPSFASLAHIAGQAFNLREMMLESPECNHNDFESLGPWKEMTDPLFALFERAAAVPGHGYIREPPLQRLQKLTLHLNGPDSPYWQLDERSIHIFRHPTLRQLHLSCVNIVNIEGFARPDNHSTPLQHLMLEECNITHEGLAGILSFPKALETLHLGENCHNVIHFRQNPLPAYTNHLFERDSKSTVEALQQQKHSLQSLTYVTAPMYSELSLFHPTTANPIDGAFADFQSLESVKLLGFCPSFERALLALQSPPNLAHLAFKAKKMFRKAQNAKPEEVSTITSIPFLRAPSASIPKSLKTLELTYTADNGLMVVELVNAGSRERSFIRDAAKVTAGMGIALRVLATRIEGENRYYPPYLYGETEAPEDVVFEHEDFTGNFKPRRQLPRALMIWRRNIDEEDRRIYGGS